MAREQLADPITVGTMMLRAGEVDGLVAGAVHTTAATVRPALQLLGTAPGRRGWSPRCSSCACPTRCVVYGDCAINPDPDAEQLADIALQSAASAPRVRHRAAGRDDQLQHRARPARAPTSRRSPRRPAWSASAQPDLLVDGPLQYDAAAIASVARSKRPDSPVAGRATVFVFPDLNTGNTTYKAVQRSADVVSIGPMLQGLAKPVNDLAAAPWSRTSSTRSRSPPSRRG